MWLLCWNDCVLVGLDWVEPMMFLLLHITCSCIFMHTYLTFSIFLYIDCDWCFSLSLSLSLSLYILLSISCSMAPKWKSTTSRDPFRFGASSPSNPTPLHVRFHDDKAWQDFWKNFSRRGIHSKHQVIFQTSPTLTYPLSFTIVVGSHCVMSRSLVHPCLYRSSTPTCMDLIIQYLSLSLAFEVRTSWSLQILYLMCSMSIG